MMTRLILSGLLAAAAIPAAGAEAPVAGVVIKTKGHPEVQHASAEVWNRLRKGDRVREGDRVRTGKRHRVAIALTGGAEVRINEESEFTLRSGGGRMPASIFTKMGQAWTRLLHGNARLQVVTPFAVAAVRGTEADVEMRERMTVKVYEGWVELYNGKGRQDLREGQMSTVGGDGTAPAPPKRIGKGDAGRWQRKIRVRQKEIDAALGELESEQAKQREMELEIDQEGARRTLKMRFEKKK